MKNLLIGLAIFVVAVVAGWYFYTNYYPKPQTSSELSRQRQLEPENPAPERTPGTIGDENAVLYSSEGFSPQNLTIEAGTTVIFFNQSGKKMWVASAVHPTHQELPGFNQLKGVGQGETYSYTFEKAGTWKYHNHLNPTDTGQVVVE